MTLVEAPPTDAAADSPADTGGQGPSSTWLPQRRGAMLAVGAIVVGLLVGLVASLLVKVRDPVYSSKAILLMDQPGAISLDSGDGVVLKLSRLRLKYAGLVGTNAIDASVAHRVGASPASVAGLVTATAPADNLNIVITSATPKRSQAAALAAATATALQRYLDREQASARIATNMRLRLSLIQPAEAVIESGNGDHRQAVVGIAAGVLAAAAVGALGLLRR